MKKKYNNTNSKAKEALPRIRQLIFEGRNAEAQALCGPAICSPSAYGMPYQTVGSLRLDFEGVDAYSDYYRELDIEKAVSLTRFTAGGVTYVREAYTSFPEQLLVIRLTASQKKSISFTARYTTPYRENTERLVTRIDNSGGSVEVLTDSTVQVKNANSVTLYVSIGTNFVNYRDVSGNAPAAARKYPQLAALYFQFGRYLPICSSQPGGQAANLQGIWNYQLRAPWDGKYTTDINVEMNYWPAESTSLPDIG